MVLIVLRVVNGETIKLIQVSLKDNGLFFGELGEKEIRPDPRKQMYQTLFYFLF